MLCWESIFHPDILAILERFVLVPGGSDAMKSKMAEQR
jgi:hypothetical protein